MELFIFLGVPLGIALGLNFIINKCAEEMNHD